ncbi:MAG: HNH endonuclease [Candidatus Aenigmarchaeota archaeon]|nr:HNH endonuclease [Candidatus Aenigmarchaeota archaeon]
MVYTEQDLIIPALEIMKSHYPNNVTTAQLISELGKRLQPTGHDAETISNRNDTYFSQKVRNLKSHDTLTISGLAEYIAGGIWKITDRRLGYVEENKPVFESMKSQGFKKRQIEKVIDADFSGIIIEEGAMEVRTTSQHERSQKLRSVAVMEFKNRNSGRLPCEACGFDFENRYGEHGKGFIEIHHKEPVHEMEITGSQTTLDEALEKVSPLCSNCHKMIHRKRGEMLSIEKLKAILMS